MPQTREHLEILNLLHTQRGVGAVTKSDLIDDDFLELVKEDLRVRQGETRVLKTPT